MSHIAVVFIAYLLDWLFGDVVSKKHPVAYMRDYIAWFEENYYENSQSRGALLVLSLLVLVVALTYAVVTYLSFLSPIFTVLFSGMIASLFVSHKTLIKSFKNTAPTQEIKHQYSQQLNAKVVAPLLYLLVFGLYGVSIYVAVRTLESMLAMHNERYMYFGAFGSRLLRWLDFIPLKLTTLLSTR
jgi:adenosylcobinamide-phosphate synthase